MKIVTDIKTFELIRQTFSPLYVGQKVYARTNKRRGVGSGDVGEVIFEDNERIRVFCENERLSKGNYNKQDWNAYLSTEPITGGHRYVVKTFQVGMKMGLTFAATDVLPRVRNVTGQAKQLGVVVGWKINGLNGEPYQIDLLKQLTNGTQDYNITFQLENQHPHGSQRLTFTDRGMKLTVQDPKNNRTWTATVVESNGTEIKIQYDGYDSKFDEWIAKTSKRIKNFEKEQHGNWYVAPIDLTKFKEKLEKLKMEIKSTTQIDWKQKKPRMKLILCVGECPSAEQINQTKFLQDSLSEARIDRMYECGHENKISQTKIDGIHDYNVWHNNKWILEKRAENCYKYKNTTTIIWSNIYIHKKNNAEEKNYISIDSELKLMVWKKAGETCDVDITFFEI